MASRDLSAFFDDGELEYESIPSKKHPKGKTYRVPSPDGRTGLYLTQLAESGVLTALDPAVASDTRLQLDDDEERRFLPLVLGCTAECRVEVTTPGETDDNEPVVTRNPPCESAFDQMMDDGVKWTLIQRCGQDAFLCFGVNQQFADALITIEGAAAAGDKAAGGEGKAEAPANREEKRAAARAAKKTSSQGKGGSSSNRASGAASTRNSRARTPGSAAPARKAPAKKTA